MIRKAWFVVASLALALSTSPALAKDKKRGKGRKAKAAAGAKADDTAAVNKAEPPLGDLPDSAKGEPPAPAAPAETSSESGGGW